MEKKKYQKGFTLAETLIVIVILGTLASLIISYMKGATQDSKEATLKRDLNIIRKQLEHAKSKSIDSATYLTTLADMVPEYLDKVPNDPFKNVNVEVTAYDGLGGWVYDSTTGEVGINVSTTRTPNDTTWGLFYSEW